MSSCFVRSCVVLFEWVCGVYVFMSVWYVWSKCLSGVGIYM